MRSSDEYSFEAGIDRQIQNFITLLERKYISTDSTTRPVDMAEKTQFLALDIIGDISVGHAFGYLETDEDLYNYNEINESSLPAMALVSVLPWLTNILHRWPFRLALPKEGDNVGFGRLMGYYTVDWQIPKRELIGFRFISEFVESRIQAGGNTGGDMMQTHLDSGLGKLDLIQQGFVSM